MGLLPYLYSRQNVVPMLSIRKLTEIFGFNTASVREFGLDRYSYVLFLYDPKKHIVGLQFTNDKKQQGIRSLVKNPRAGYMVHGGSFLSYCDPQKKYRGKSYPVKWDAGKALMTFILK